MFTRASEMRWKLSFLGYNIPIILFKYYNIIFSCLKVQNYYVVHESVGALIM